MSLKKLLTTAVALAAMTPGLSHAKPAFTILGTGTYTLPESPAESAIGYGGGLLVGFPAGKAVGFELGGMYLTRATSTADVTAQSASVHLPLFLKFNLGQVVRLGAGGYYDVSLEDGGENTYGAGGSLGVVVPLGKRGGTGLVLEGRYLHDLRGDEGAPNAIQAIVGVTFGGDRRR